MALYSTKYSTLTNSTNRFFTISLSNATQITATKLNDKTYIYICAKCIHFLKH